jgi:hypothetical protein
MKVYVVIKSIYKEFLGVEKIFKSEKSADAYIKNKNEYDSNEFEVIELEVEE